MDQEKEAAVRVKTGYLTDCSFDKANCTILWREISKYSPNGIDYAVSTHSQTLVCLVVLQATLFVSKNRPRYVSAVILACNAEIRRTNFDGCNILLGYSTG